MLLILHHELCMRLLVQDHEHPTHNLELGCVKSEGYVIGVMARGLVQTTFPTIESTPIDFPILLGSNSINCSASGNTYFIDNPLFIYLVLYA